LECKGTKNEIMKKSELLVAGWNGWNGWNVGVLE
jgi:hypothetical protein